MDDEFDFRSKITGGYTPTHKDHKYVYITEVELTGTEMRLLGVYFDSAISKEDGSTLFYYVESKICG